jgi:hypothetical protein
MGQNSFDVLVDISGYPGMMSWMQARGAVFTHPVQVFAEGIEMFTWAEQFDDNVPVMLRYGSEAFTVMMLTALVGTGAQLGTIRIAVVSIVRFPLDEMFGLARESACIEKV